jgi:putative restriction endonuclease
VDRREGEVVVRIGHTVLRRSKICLMDQYSSEHQIRAAAFEFLDRLSLQYGEVLPSTELRAGFTYEDQRVPLMGPQGIFKPAVLEWPLSITTVPVVPGKVRPYEDELGSDGFLRYRYRGTDPGQKDNRGLREAMQRKLPLVYFHGVEPGQYLAEWPVFIVGDEPNHLTFTVQVDDPFASGQDPADELPDDARRAYATRVAKQRLHQLAFRHRVLRAYRESCAMCRLHHKDLLDAAHILPDTHPDGEPVTSNGLALCKLHHAAFDRNIAGVRPDSVIEIRHDVLEEIDGSMLRHGLQDLHGQPLVVVPNAVRDRPARNYLAERYAIFRAAC